MLVVQVDAVGELVLKSDDFARLWARHDVRFKLPGSKRFRHPVVGEFTLSYETFAVTASAGQTLIVYHAEPGGPGADALSLLASQSASAAAGRAPGQVLDLAAAR